MLYILVDAFLFEGASIREALLQFVNVAFDLGIAQEDRRFLAKVRERLPVSPTSNTGLEQWIETARRPAWLTELIELRNVTTHRHPLRLPEQYQWRDDGTTPPAWQGHVGIEATPDRYELLESFIERTERELSSLLRASLERLGTLRTE
jgi:hypothetical protein